MTDMTSEIRIKSPISYLGEIIFHCVIVVLCLWALWSYTQWVFPVLTLLGIFILFDAMPFIILHRQYFVLNRNMLMNVDRARRLITVSDQGRTHTIKLDHIEPVKIVTSWEGNGSWSGHQYVILQTDEGKVIVITSLLVKKLPQFFAGLGVEAIRERQLFPFLWGEDKFKVQSSAA